MCGDRGSLASSPSNKSNAWEIQQQPTEATLHKFLQRKHNVLSHEIKCILDIYNKAESEGEMPRYDKRTFSKSTPAIEQYRHDKLTNYSPK